MKVIYDDYKEIKNQKQLTITLGNFDGFHIGHQRLVERVMSYDDTAHAVMTFDPHPSEVLGRQNFYVLSKREDKEKYIASFNLDFLFIVKFTQELSKLSVDQFINFLKSINVKRIVVGKDARFAYRGQGTINDLKKYFFVDVLDDYLYEQMRVSTTYIKDFIRQGELMEARKLLNKPYEISGNVVYGNQIGKDLGFPTANIDYENYLLPKTGVYFVQLIIDGAKYPGIANIGYNPTLNYSQTKKLEVFILDFHGDIYHKDVRVTFEYYIRDEKKFNSRDELIRQIKKDETEARKLMG